MNIIVADHHCTIRRIIESNSELFDQDIQLKYVKNMLGLQHQITEAEPDLVLLDLQGVERDNYLEGLCNFPYSVITFSNKVTYLTRALSSFQNFTNLYYPISGEEIINEIHQLNTIKSKEFHVNEKYENQLQRSNKRITVSSSKKIVFVYIDDIVYCKANRQYTEIHIKCGKMILSSRTLSYYQNSLPELLFMRIHRSFLVNLNYVNEFHRDNDELLLSNNNSIKLSYNMKEDFLSRMERI